MLHYVGLDVSTQTVSICIVEKEGNIAREATLACEVDIIDGYLQGTNLEIEKIGMESGNLSHWLATRLAEKGYSTVIMDARKMAGILATLINKTDQNDARGIAEALRVGHYRECVQRSNRAIEIKTILHCRGTLVRERTHLTNSLKGHLKQYGIKLGRGCEKDFKQRVMETIKDLSETIKLSVKCLLNTLEALNKEISILEVKIKKITKEDEDVELLKTIDGVGDIVALAFISEIDKPTRFKRSRYAAAYLGLTPSQYSSGEIQRQGRISKKGSKDTRYLLVEAATIMLTRCKKWSKQKAWGMKLMRRIGKKKAIVALARKLAVTMHRILETRESFQHSYKKAKKNKKAA